MDSKVAGYKINIQKCVGFLHTDKNIYKKEIKKTTSVTISLTKIKYLRINLIKEVKELSTEN